MSTILASPATPTHPGARAAPPVTAGGFRVALWLALVVGLIQHGGRLLKIHSFHQIVLYTLNPHAAWMTLVDSLLVFGIVGVIGALAARCCPLFFPLRVLVFAYAALAFLALGDMVVVKQSYASLALALGLAATAGRLARSLLAVARFSLLPLAGAAAALALGAYARSVVAESRTGAAPPSAPEGAPNVLLITLDTVRAKSLGLYGSCRPTSPRLEEFALQGVCFDRAIATVSWTLPSHASLFTGHYPQEMFADLPRMHNDAWEVPMDARFPTLAEFLGARGYRTAGFVANWWYCDRVYGLDRGFAHYQDFHVGLEHTLKSTFLTQTVANRVLGEVDDRMILARKDGPTLNGEFLHWLDRSKGRPFFAFLNYMDAHEPYHPPPPFAGRFISDGQLATWIVPKNNRPYPQVIARLKDDYECGVAAVDHFVGQLLDDLDHRGILKNTLVVLTSDHGEMLGEHDKLSHGDTLYLPVIHVPLLVVWPEHVPAGVRVRGTASLRDVPATIAELLGMAGTSPFPGASLRHLWQGALPAPAYSDLDIVIRQPQPTRTVRLRSLVDSRYHYLESLTNDPPQVYDLERDPEEGQNLAETPVGQRLVRRYHADLLAHHAHP